MSLDINGPLCECGMKGCYEAFCGGRAMAKRMRMELVDKSDHKIVELAGGDIEKVDMLALEEAVRYGDGYAIALWDDFCLHNAQAIGSLINIFNPDRIVLGTIAVASGDLFIKPLLKYLPDFCWEEPFASCELALSSLGKQIAEYSGVCVALNGLREKNG
jgi:glucokinase